MSKCFVNVNSHLEDSRSEYEEEQKFRNVLALRTIGPLKVPSKDYCIVSACQVEARSLALALETAVMPLISTLRFRIISSMWLRTKAVL